MASNDPGEFFRSAGEARRVAKEIRAGKTPERPKGRNISFADYERDYAALVRLTALSRMEEFLESETLTPADAAILLAAARDHEAAMRNRERPERPEKGTGHNTKFQRDEKALRDVEREAADHRKPGKGKSRKQQGKPEPVPEPEAPPAPPPPVNRDFTKLDTFERPEPVSP